MGNRRKSRYAALLVAAALVALLPGAVTAPVQAATQNVTTAAFTYIPPAHALAVGDSLTYTNVDIAPHDVTSDDGLFQSATIPSGTTPVVGVSSLAAGTYAFHCSLHPFMKGALSVGAGLPAIPTIPGLPGLGDLIATVLGLLGLLPGGTLNPPPPVPSVSVVPVGVVPTPTSVAFGNGALYATSYGLGNVFRMPVMAGGVLGVPTVHASGFTNPLGVAVGPDGTVFVSDSHPSATPGRAVAGRVRAVPPSGGDVGAVVIDELPNGRHNTNGMSVHNGRLYIANGNSTDDGVAGGQPEAPLSGTLISVPLSARNVVIPPSGLPPVDVIVHAKGMRNLFDVAFRPGTDEAWFPTNGPDALEPLGEDLLHKADVTQATADFGFPACVYSSTLPAPRWAQNPAVLPGQVCTGAQTLPATLLGLHVSADGLDFGPNNVFWKGDLFIAEYGNNPGETLAGHKIVRVPIGPGGIAGTPTTFLLAPTPLGLTFGPDGMYVADFGSGSISLLKPLV